jgi:hypothetical protein
MLFFYRQYKVICGTARGRAIQMNAILKLSLLQYVKKSNKYVELASMTLTNHMYDLYERASLCADIPKDFDYNNDNILISAR